MQNLSQNISNDMIIQRFGQGIKLIPPEKAGSQQQITISSMLPMPIHVYLMNTESVLQTFNERGASTFGLLSSKDAIGLTARDLATKKTAERSIFFDRMVVNDNTMIIKDELYTRLDGIDFTTLSFKFPWYDYENNIIGIFGFSMLIDQKWGISLADSMLLITRTGLLQPGQVHRCLPGMSCDGEYFSAREKEVLLHLIRGKTARETAAALGLSPRTIEHHIENMKIKSGSSSKSELIDKMIDHFYKV